MLKSGWIHGQHVTTPLKLLTAALDICTTHYYFKLKKSWQHSYGSVPVRGVVLFYAVFKITGGLRCIIVSHSTICFGI